MAKKTENTQSGYGEARQAFDDLKLEEKARFVLEAVLSTVADGIDKVSQAISDSVDDVMCEGESDVDSAPSGNGGSKRSSKGGSKSTSGKRSAKKSGGRKKSTSSRTSGDAAAE